MENLPLYGSMKKTMTTLRKQINTGVQQGEWVYIFIYFLILAFLFWAMYLGVRSAYYAAYPKESLQGIINNIPATTTSIQATNSNIVVGNSAPVNQTLIVNPKEKISPPILNYEPWIGSYWDGSKNKYVANFFVIIAYVSGDKMDEKIQINSKIISCKFMGGYDDGITKYITINGESRLAIQKNVQCFSSQPIVDNGNLFSIK